MKIVDIYGNQIEVTDFPDAVRHLISFTRFTSMNGRLRKRFIVIAKTYWSELKVLNHLSAWIRKSRRV